AGKSMMLTVYVRNFDAVLQNVMAQGRLKSSPTVVGHRRYFRCADHDDNFIEVVEAIEVGEGNEAPSQSEDINRPPTSAAGLAGLEVRPVVDGERLLLSVANRTGKDVDVSGAVIHIEGVASPTQATRPLRWDDWLDEIRQLKSGQNGFLVLFEENGGSGAIKGDVIRRLSGGAQHEPIAITVMLR